MAGTGKDFASVNLALWGDDQYLDLTIEEQLLFLTLWTSPALTYCGAGPWHSGRLSQMASDWDRGRVERAAEGLSEKLFLVVDADTEEYLLRSWIKHDGLWKSPNMAVSMANARAELASRSLRGVIVHEVLKLRDANPELSGWDRQAVRSMLEQKPIDPATLAPFRSSTTQDPTPPLTPSPTPSPTPALRVSPGVGVNPPANPTPTPAPAPFSCSIEVRAPDEHSSDSLPSLMETAASGAAAPQPKRGTRVPEDWQPARTDGNLTAEAGHDDRWLAKQLQLFKNYYLSKSGSGALRTSWDRTWQNWLIKADEYDRARPRTAASMSATDWDRIMAEAKAQDERNPS